MVMMMAREQDDFLFCSLMLYDIVLIYTRQNLFRVNGSYILEPERPVAHVLNAIHTFLGWIVMGGNKMLNETQTRWGRYA